MTLDPKPILSRLLPVELHRLLTRETLLHETIAKVVLEYLRETARPIHAWGDRLEAETVVDLDNVPERCAWSRPRALATYSWSAGGLCWCGRCRLTATCRSSACTPWPSARPASNSSIGPSLGTPTALGGLASALSLRNPCTIRASRTDTRIGKRASQTKHLTI